MTTKLFVNADHWETSIKMYEPTRHDIFLEEGVGKVVEVDSATYRKYLDAKIASLDFEMAMSRMARGVPDGISEGEAVVFESVFASD